MIYLFIIIVFLFSVIIHEVAHGAVANHLGDTTAKDAGRLNLNPLRHLDPIGSVIVPLFLYLSSSVAGGGVIFGWAKPVPINPYNFRDRKWGEMKVAAAGPLSNLSLALVFGLFLRFLPLTPSFVEMFSYIVFINIQLAVFNLLPIPPLDGSHIFLAFIPGLERFKMFFQSYGFFLLVLVVFFFYPALLYIIDKIFWLFAGFPLLSA